MESQLPQEEDCSYQWEIIQDRPHFESLYNTYKTTNTSDASIIQGFTTSDKVYVFNGAYVSEVLTHEVSHAICNLTYDDPLDCHMGVELRDYGTFDEDETGPCNWCQSHVKPKDDVWRYM